MNQSPAGDAVDTIEREHDVQFGLFDALGRALDRKAPARELESILRQVADYSRMHFMSEQLLMRLHAYPEYRAHVIVHDRLNDAFEHALVLVGQDPVDAEQVAAAIDGVRSQLEAHMKSQDRAFHTWLPDEGLK